MTDTAANADQIAYWNDAAGQTWADLQDLLDIQVEPLGRRVLEGLGLAAGERVLDIGCGCGQTTLAIAERVGASGAATGVDISQPMLTVARARAAGARNVEFIEADAQTFAFQPVSYDAAFSRFGVMFFEDPVAAFANLRRALKRGGRLAFLCWRSVLENPIMSLPMAAASKYVPPPEPSAPGAPGPFAFADAERVQTILAAAGYSDISIQPQDMPAGGQTLEDALRLSLRVGPLGRQLREHPEGREAAISAIRAAFSEHLTGGRVFLDSATWIVTARNP